MAENTTEWDVFVSYTKTDRDWAEWIAWQLEGAGWRVLIQAWDMVPGRNWVHAMQEGARRSARTLAVLSSDYLLSVYGTAEWEVAWAADPLGLQRTLLTARVENCGRPGLLGTIVGIDVFDVPEDEARRRLVDAVRAAITGRARPTTPPAFPGRGPAVVRPAFPRGG